MPIGCKGVCYRYQSIRGGMYSAYKKGFKRCTECSIYILNMKGTGVLPADILWELKEELHERNKGAQEWEEFS